MASFLEMRRLGRAFAGFLAWTARKAREQEAERIWFLSREGRWFTRQYERMRRSGARPDRFPSAAHLPVSRLSTFLPSLEHIDEDALAPLLKQYGWRTTGAILGSLGFFHAAPTNLIEALRREGVLERPWRECGRQTLARDEVRNHLEQYRARQRRNLLLFLKQRGISQDSPRVFVADIGWRGSIQDNLARLLSGVRFTGLYFHLQPFFAEQLPNTEKHGFLNGEENSLSRSTLRRLRFAAPLEFAVMDYHSGPVIGYEVRGEIAQEETAPDPAAPDLEGLSRLRREMEGEIGRHDLESAADPEAAVSDVLNYLENPSAAIIDLFFSMPRDDFFGGGRVCVGADRIGYGSLLKALLNRNARQQLGWKLAESHWPWAVLRRDVPLLAPMLVRVLNWMDTRLPTSTAPSSR